MISDLPHIDMKVYEAFTENITCMYKQCVPGLSLGMGDGGAEPGNEADTMEDYIDSALCGYGFHVKVK